MLHSSETAGSHRVSAIGPIESGRADGCNPGVDPSWLIIVFALAVLEHECTPWVRSSLDINIGVYLFKQCRHRYQDAFAIR